VLVLLGLGTLVILWLAQQRNGYFDSKVYYGAVRYWFRDGGMVYDYLRPGTPYGFTYPPLAGLLMLPMAYLPFPAVVVLACVFTVVSTAVLTWWLAAPLIRRVGGPRWFALGVAACLALSFEPVRETLSFGQVNTMLLLVVVGDVLFGVSRGRRWAGVGIGLATAVKLTPGVFILYLLVTRRWRAAGTAIGAAAAVTVAAAAIAPDQSREFWTSALWDTNRVGVLAALSNQSLRGFVARLGVGGAEQVVWGVLVLAALGVWLWRVRAAGRAGDHVAELALTGVLGCLISPVTWIHHCVWLIPALVHCADVGLAEPRRRRPLYLAVAGYLVMTSRVTWLWENGPRPPLALLGSNLYVYFSVALLVFTPIRPGPAALGLPQPAALLRDAADPRGSGRQDGATGAQAYADDHAQ
jgi:alpha-1,2-mannosyltransferase